MAFPRSLIGHLIIFLNSDSFVSGSGEDPFADPFFDNVFDDKPKPDFGSGPKKSIFDDPNFNQQPKPETGGGNTGGNDESTTKNDDTVRGNVGGNGRTPKIDFGNTGGKDIFTDPNACKKDVPGCFACDVFKHTSCFSCYGMKYVATDDGGKQSCNYMAIFYILIIGGILVVLCPIAIIIACCFGFCTCAKMAFGKKKGAPPPQGAVFTQPPNGAYAQPENGAYAQPANGAYVQPANEAYAQPTNEASMQPASGGYVQPAPTNP